MNFLGKAPCMNCEDRQLGCHSICQKYKDWKENLEKMKRGENTKKEFNNVYYPHHFKQINKACKKRNISFRNNIT